MSSDLVVRGEEMTQWVIDSQKPLQSEKGRQKACMNGHRFGVTGGGGQVKFISVVRIT